MYFTEGVQINKARYLMKKFAVRLLTFIGMSAIIISMNVNKAYAKESEFYSVAYDVTSSNHTTKKSFESYTVFGRNTNQQKLQEIAVTDEHGFRMINGNYLVAVGSKFGMKIGQYFDLVLEDGTIIHCIMGDEKDDDDTDKHNVYTSNGCMSEFIVDTSRLDSTVAKMGDCSYLNDNWNSRVVEVIVYSWNVLDGQYIGYWD